MTFDDVALYFSEQEWEILEKWQKEMYQQVMKTNYETLDSLGKMASKESFLGKLPTINRLSVLCELLLVEYDSLPNLHSEYVINFYYGLGIFNLSLFI